MSDFNASNNEYPDRLLKIQDVIEILKLSKSTFWEGVRQGRYPQAIKLGPKITRWRLKEIMALIS